MSFAASSFARSYQLPVASTSRTPLAIKQPPKSPFYDVWKAGSVTEIVIHQSDGDDRLWPGQDRQTKVVGEDLSVNFYDHPDEKNEKLWRKMIGNYLARKVLKQDGYEVDTRNCYLRSFPDGYKLFRHKKGHKDAARRDSYLFGFRRIFRSPEEFARHAKWLMEGGASRSGPHSSCNCIYCNREGLKQKDISEEDFGRHFSRDKSQTADKGKAKEDGKEKKQRRRRISDPPPIRFKDYRNLVGDQSAPTSPNDPFPNFTL
ncbi:hypothetical protein JAAARDRAFT_197286 [Jaapia argillacea MUCL 33604]|uniref:Cryptic loci regulator 2 N-terminal domain-containing protein n=1 Tax=Jaapia argillacea MUCL 33604 TaxID=933084 RepID=A0A067PFD8_9AGAM|nr:hypothetical protein JAAARDRAFT_197286 [Jaapia argillacea MUCL 33604]